MWVLEKESLYFAQYIQSDIKLPFNYHTDYEADHHSMFIDMEHEISNKSHLLPAGSHNTAVPYLTRETRC